MQTKFVRWFFFAYFQRSVLNDVELETRITNRLRVSNLITVKINYVFPKRFGEIFLPKILCFSLRWRREERCSFANVAGNGL